MFECAGWWLVYLMSTWHGHLHNDWILKIELRWGYGEKGALGPFPRLV